MTPSSICDVLQSRLQQNSHSLFKMCITLEISETAGFNQESAFKMLQQQERLCDFDKHQTTCKVCFSLMPG